MGWVEAIGTVAASIVALALGLGLADWWKRPKLSLHSDPYDVSDRVVTTTVAGEFAAYLRLRVRNDGRSSARGVQVAIVSVETWPDNTRRWIRGKPELDGRPLTWANDPRATADIPAGVERYLDVVWIPRRWQEQGQMPLVLSIQLPHPANNAQVLGPGGWRLRLQVSGDNIPATPYEIQVTFDGYWPADPPHRIWDAVAVRGPASTIDADEPPRPRMRGAEQQLAQAMANDEGQGPD